MIINKKQFLNLILLLLFLVIMLFFYLKNIDYTGKNVLILFTFIANGTIIIINILKDLRAFSLNKMFWYFSFFFLFLAPFFQYLTSYNCWDYVLEDRTYIRCNLYLILWYFVYSISNAIFLKKKNINIKCVELDLNYKKMKFMFLLSLLSFIILVTNISFSGLFVRNSNSMSIDYGAFKAILENTLRAIPVYSLIYSFFCLKSYKKGYIYFIILLFITLSVNFPTSITRFWIGIVYIGIGLVVFRRYIINRRFDYAMILIFTIVFPIFQLFKWYTIEQIIDFTTISNKLISVYNNVDFDAYSMLGRTIEYIDLNGITFGHQLLSTLFFFVPRAIWSTKPLPSGEFIAIQQGQKFTNLSCPLIAEGLINFGIIGLILFALILGKIISYFDSIFWKNFECTTFLYLIYPFGFGVLIFLLRGAMQPVAVYAFTFYFFTIFLKKFIIKNKNINYVKISKK